MATSTQPMNLRDLYARESARIRRVFEATGDGIAAASQRSALVDQVALRLWQELISAEEGAPRGFCLVARGGYGRGTLLPCSDIDLLFLSDNAAVLSRHRQEIGRICQQLWDLHLRASPTARTLSGCAGFDPNNPELTLSLLDTHYIAGDRQMLERLQRDTVPGVVHRNGPALVQRLLELTRARHAKYGSTVFHLEPNVKDCPGGLRDYNTACWLSLLTRLQKQKRGEHQPPDPPVRDDIQASVGFLMAVRCFLHYFHGRDDNTLTWEAQDAAVARRIGIDGRRVKDAAEWMRNYFRHARPVSRWTNQLLDELAVARSSLYRDFLRWRSRVSNADFSVVDGRVYLQQSSAVADPELPLHLFGFVAHHGLNVASDTERRLALALPALRDRLPQGTSLWSYLKEILLAPHAAHALRSMHALGLLTAIIPEYQLIDSLVVRDFYHRYTVDEHSFTAIESLHHLKTAETEWEARYRSILGEVEAPELLLLAVVLHDIGKGMTQGSHIEGSLRAAQAAFARLSLPEPQRETVRFLIANHLEMSAALRRDIFDPDVVRAFARKVGTPERLKMLCLLTYADIRAVNPQALTPWKAEDLWHLYVTTANCLNHSADDESFPAALQAEYLGKIAALVPRRRRQLRVFLATLPQRYLAAHSAEQIALHFAMASKRRQHPVQVDLRFSRNLYELTVVTGDRPALFATISGALTAWGMDIVKANAFTSQDGLVVDTFSFCDRFRTLEMNPPERERFERNLIAVLAGEANVEPLLESRLHTGRIAQVKVTVATRFTFDNASSAHSTLLEVIAQDRPGLLYRIASTLARHGCNIEIALIDTEGQMAVDVFYVTHAGAKLDAAVQSSLRAGLHEELEADQPNRPVSSSRFTS